MLSGRNLSSTKSTILTNFQLVTDYQKSFEAFSASDLVDRSGYSVSFLDQDVALPIVSSEFGKQIPPVIGVANGLLNYTHYSVLMHPTRRLAIYAAANINGKLWRHIPRTTSDKWFFDPRLKPELQAGNELYTGNKLDRGHLVRRLDPSWGESYEEALQAERDTFFYTNCAPQHDQMNRKSWLGLEDYILENTNVHDLKVTVFNGPIFRKSDRSYRGFKVPEDYWKVVVIVKQETKKLSATAYVISQWDLLDDLEFSFGEYKTYQVQVSKVEALTQLSFGDLNAHDPMHSHKEKGNEYLTLDSLESIQI